MLTFFREISAWDIVKAILEKYLKLVPEDSEMQSLYDELSREK